MAQLALKAVSWGAEKVSILEFRAGLVAHSTLRSPMKPFMRSPEATFAHRRLTSRNEGNARRRRKKRRSGRRFERK